MYNLAYDTHIFLITMERCAGCQGPGKHYCAGCNSTAYCSLKCAEHDWPVHHVLCGMSSLSIDGKLKLKEMQELPVVQTLTFSMPDLKDYSINVAWGGHDKPQIRVDLSRRLVWIVLKEDQSKKLSKAIYKAEKRLRKAIKAARDVDPLQSKTSGKSSSSEEEEEELPPAPVPPPAAPAVASLDLVAAMQRVEGHLGLPKRLLPNTLQKQGYEVVEGQPPSKNWEEDGWKKIPKIHYLFKKRSKTTYYYREIVLTNAISLSGGIANIANPTNDRSNLSIRISAYNGKLEADVVERWSEIGPSGESDAKSRVGWRQSATTLDEVPRLLEDLLLALANIYELDTRSTRKAFSDPKFFTWHTSWTPARPLLSKRGRFTEQRPG